jgi:hypothetical protein
MTNTTERYSHFEEQDDSAFEGEKDDFEDFGDFDQNDDDEFDDFEEGLEEMEPKTPTSAERFVNIDERRSVYKD